MLHTHSEKTLQIRGLSFKKTVPIPVAILRSPTLSPGAKLLFAELLSYAWFNAECYPGQTKLSKDLQVSVDTIKRKLDELKGQGLINWDVRGLGQTNIYYINDIPQSMQIEAESAPVQTLNSAPVRNKVNEEEVNKDNENAYNGSADTNVSPKQLVVLTKQNPTLREDPHSDPILYAIKYYFQEYQNILGRPHPILKPRQMQRVYEELSTFNNDWTPGEGGWETMIDRWFRLNVETDYNINHFATYGIMQNRFWETLY